MIKIKDITKTGYSEILDPFDLNRCLDFNAKATLSLFRDKKVKANLLVHDGYDISLIKVLPNEKIFIKIGSNNVSMTYEELFHKFIYVYPFSFNSETLENVSSRYLEHSLTIEDDTYVVVIPEQILDIAKKIGYNRESFVNNVLYTFIANSKNVKPGELSTLLHTDKGVISNIFKSSYYNLPFVAYAHSQLVARIENAMMLDLVCKGLTHYEKGSFVKFILLNDTIEDVVTRITLALQAYITKGTITELKKVYKYLYENKEHFGLFSLFAINHLESVISGSSVIHEVDGDIISLSLNGKYKNLEDIVKETLKKQNMIGIRESVDFFKENMVASQQFSVYSTTEPNVSQFVPLIKGRMPEGIDTPEQVVEDAKSKTPELVEPLSKFYIDKYMNQYHDYSSIETFVSPEEKEAMVKKMVRLLDDVMNTKTSLSRGNDFDYTEKVNVEIYDVLANKITQHIDFLNNIKYYGDDPEIGTLNREVYISSENFNLLSIPKQYFPGMISANAYGEVKIFGGQGNPISNLKNNTLDKFSKDIKDKEGNVIRNSRDKVYYRSPDDNNMTNKEIRRFHNKVARKMMNPGDNMRSPLRIVTTRAFDGAVRNIDTFFSGVQSLFYAILSTITLGIVSESFENYDGDVYVSSEAIIRNAKDYEFHNQVSTLGDKMDNVINAAGGKLVDGAANVARVVTGNAIVRGAMDKTREAVDATKEKTVEATKAVASRTASMSKNMLWTLSKISFLYYIVRPIVLLFKKMIKGDVKNKHSQTVLEKKSYIKEKSATCYTMSDKICQTIKDDKRFSDKDRAKMIAVRDAFAESDEEVEEDIKEASAESFDINGINKMILNKKITLSTLNDIDNLSKRIYNTIKNANSNIDVQYIQYEDLNGRFWAIIGTNYGYVVFNLDNGYEIISRELAPQVKDITIGSKVIAVNAHTMSDANVSQIIIAKESVKKQKQKENLEAEAEEDIKHAKVREFEQELLKKMQKKGMIKNGKEKYRTDDKQ